MRSWPPQGQGVGAVHVPVAGRTHGMHAEPTTFGAKFALWALQADRDRLRLRRRESVAVGKLSGAVGTYSNIDPEVEARVCAALGLTPVPATQVIARDRHAEYLYACAAIGATIELMCTEIRHLARSELGEAEEPFGAGQKGSSSMPHKRNPILSERLCGLARLFRGYLGAGLEDVALWHERDISHSSVERVALPDASLLACYVLRKATGLAGGWSSTPNGPGRTWSRVRSGWSSPRPSCWPWSWPAARETRPTASSTATPGRRGPNAARSGPSSRPTPRSR